MKLTCLQKRMLDPVVDHVLANSEISCHLVDSQFFGLLQRGRRDSIAEADPLDYLRRVRPAFAVVQQFAKTALRFPRRSYGGAWNGKLIWGCLTHGRVLYLLKNPSYAGMYVFGRYQYRRQIHPSGEVGTRMRRVPMAEWRVSLQEHHEGYIGWDEYLKNQERCQSKFDRASRETSSAKTAPTCPIETSATKVLKSSRPVICAPDLPRSRSRT